MLHTITPTTVLEWELILSTGLFSANQAHPEAMPDAIVAKLFLIREAFYEWLYRKLLAYQ